MATLNSDREFLEQHAAELEANDVSPEVTSRLRAIASSIGQRVEYVDQFVVGKKQGVADAPDGWGWADVRGGTGNFSGVRWQTGEPIIYQAGHLLLVRQALTSKTPEGTRKRNEILRYATTLRAPDEDRPAVRALLVQGFMGERHWMIEFKDGKQTPMEEATPESLSDFADRFLQESYSDPIVPERRRRHADDGFEQPQLT